MDSIIRTIYRGYDVSSVNGDKWYVYNSQSQCIWYGHSEKEAQQFIDARKKAMPNHG